MKKFNLGLRIVFGLFFLVFGLNGFFNFFAPPAPSVQGGLFLGALGATGYIFPIVKALETLVGVALLSNKFVPLALIVLFPISINILLFNTMLNPAGAPIAIFTIAANLYLAWVNKNAYSALLKA
jgi:putative oxidoreductase